MEQAVACARPSSAESEPGCPDASSTKPASLNAEKSERKLRPTKTPTGMRDLHPPQVMIMRELQDHCRRVFQQHGAVEIETPMVELRDTMTGNYGAGGKQIYEIKERGDKERLALRYDHTVPFGRYVAANGLRQMRRFVIGQVFRYDPPTTSKGRYCQFVQCDYDICGNFDAMVPDAECFCVMDEILGSIPELGPYTLKVNHRQLLDAILQLSGVPDVTETRKLVSNCIDRLDKAPWEEVSRDIAEIPGVTAECIGRLGGFVQIRGGPRESLDRLRATPLADLPAGRTALMEMGLLFDYLERFGVLDRVTLDMSMVRGLDYYTGPIVEAVLTGDGPRVGSIAAGGRYDDLIDEFSHTERIGAVGVSMGIERMLYILEQAEIERGNAVRENKTQVLVASMDGVPIGERMALCKQLWKLGVAAEFVFDANPAMKMRKNFEHAESKGIPWMAIIGPDELKAGTVSVRNMDPTADRARKQCTLPRAEALDLLCELARPSSEGAEAQDPRARFDRACQGCSKRT